MWMLLVYIPVCHMDVTGKYYMLHSAQCASVYCICMSVCVWDCSLLTAWLVHNMMCSHVSHLHRIEATALLVGVGEGGEVLREVACETHQGECWSVVWNEHETPVQWSHRGHGEGVQHCIMSVFENATALVWCTVGCYRNNPLSIPHSLHTERSGLVPQHIVHAYYT